MKSIFIHGNGNVIINGRNISSHIQRNGEKREFNKIIREKAEYIKSIHLENNCADVNISKTDGSEIVIELVGSGIVTNGNCILEAKVEGDILFITSEIVGEFFESDIHLNILIPNSLHQFIYNISSGDIKINKEIFIKNIQGCSQSGDFKSYADFEYCKINSMSGNIKLFLDAKNNVSCNLDSMSGDIKIKLNNFRSLYKKISCMNGDIDDCFESSNSLYTANLNISSMSGDIDIY